MSKLLEDDKTTAILCLAVLGLGCIVATVLGNNVESAMTAIIGAMGGMAMGRNGNVKPS